MRNSSHREPASIRFDHYHRKNLLNTMISMGALLRSAKYEMYAPSDFAFNVKLDQRSATAEV